MSLRGKRVLITRPAHQADDFAQRLRRAGALPVIAPTIAIVPPADAPAALDAVRRVHEYDWLVFTSGNAVDAFFERLAELARDASALADVAIAAIGPKTAHALAQRGVRDALVPAAYVGEAVAHALLERTAPGQRVLLYRAQEGRAIVRDVLRAAGRQVDDVAAYATRIVDDPTLARRAAGADVVTFTSASTVRGFVRNVPDAARSLLGARVACIGPVTAAAAREAGIRVDVVAPEFTVEGLMRALDPAAL